LLRPFSQVTNHYGLLRTVFFGLASRGSWVRVPSSPRVVVDITTCRRVQPGHGQGLNERTNGVWSLTGPKSVDLAVSCWPDPRLVVHSLCECWLVSVVGELGAVGAVGVHHPDLRRC